MLAHHNCTQFCLFAVFFLWVFLWVFCLVWRRILTIGSDGLIWIGSSLIDFVVNVDRWRTSHWLPWWIEFKLIEINCIWLTLIEFYFFLFDLIWFLNWIEFKSIQFNWLSIDLIEILNWIEINLIFEFDWIDLIELLNLIQINLKLELNWIYKSTLSYKKINK